jgi:hypothetical protein
MSEGASKSGDKLNLIIDVSVSDRDILKRAASAPDEIVTVADSDTRIVAAVADVVMFSAAENEEEAKVGGVVSATVKVVGFKFSRGTITYELCPAYDQSKRHSAPPPCSCIQSSIGYEVPATIDMVPVPLQLCPVAAALAEVSLIMKDELILM